MTQFPGRLPWCARVAAPGTPQYAARSPDLTPFSEGSLLSPAPPVQPRWEANTDQGTDKTRSPTLYCSRNNGSSKELRHHGHSGKCGGRRGTLAAAEVSTRMPQKGLSLVTVPSPPTLLIPPLRLEVHAALAMPQLPIEGRARRPAPRRPTDACGAPHSERTAIGSLCSTLSPSAWQQGTQRPSHARRGPAPGSLLAAVFKLQSGDVFDSGTHMA